MRRKKIFALCSILSGALLQTVVAANAQPESLQYAEETPIIVTPEYAEESSQQVYVCRQQGLVRRVKLVYLEEPPVPCEVRYIKESEAPGSVQVLWSADVDEGFCEAKASAFVEKLGSWGWDCSEPEVAARLNL